MIDRRRFWLFVLAAPWMAAATAQLPSADRPQLAATAAARYQAAAYLSQGPAPWQPAEVDSSTWAPDFVVAEGFLLDDAVAQLPEDTAGEA